MKPKDHVMPSRREFVRAATAGLAAALTAPALAQQWPGLASKMNPRPDHGEKSYQGSGRLLGRKALLTGGDSGIGRAAAIAFAREGADVAINYLPVEEPDAHEVIDLIRAEGRRAVAIPGDIRSEEFCSRLVAQAVRGLGRLDILVNNAAMQATQDDIADIRQSSSTPRSDQRLRHVLDHQSRPAASGAGRRHHQYFVRPGL